MSPIAVHQRHHDQPGSYLIAEADTHAIPHLQRLTFAQVPSDPIPAGHSAAVLEALSQTFRAIDVPTGIPRTSGQPGIYLLVAGCEVVYVGSSAHVEHRLYTHSLKQPDQKRFDRAMWLPLPLAVHPHYEGAFIRALRPRHNGTAPRHRGHDLEILEGFGIAQLVEPAQLARRPARIRGAFARLLVAARCGAGLSIQELAWKLGVARSTIGHWETGYRTPSYAWLTKIAAALGCPVADLLPTEASP